MESCIDFEFKRRIRRPGKVLWTFDVGEESKRSFEVILRRPSFKAWNMQIKTDPGWTLILPFATFFLGKELLELEIEQNSFDRYSFAFTKKKHILPQKETSPLWEETNLPPVKRNLTLWKTLEALKNVSSYFPFMSGRRYTGARTIFEQKHLYQSQLYDIPEPKKRKFSSKLKLRESIQLQPDERRSMFF